VLQPGPALAIALPEQKILLLSFPRMEHMFPGNATENMEEVVLLVLPIMLMMEFAVL
jgi:hypothetical protein